MADIKIRTVLEVHLNSRPVGHLAQPYVQVLTLARLEEEDIVAIVQLGELIELVELGL